MEDFERFPSGADFKSSIIQGWLQKLGLRQNIDLLQVASSLPSGAKVPIFDPTETGQNKTKAIDASLLGGGGGGVGQNVLINGSGAVNQRANTSALADDTYGHDRWYRLSQSNAIAVSNVTNAEDGTPYMMRLTQSNASAQRMGYAQIIEGKNCKHLRGQQVTFKLGRVRLSSSANVRYAVLEWTGTEDSVTSDVVNDWTSSTYTAGNFFLGSNLTVSGTVQQVLTANTLTDGSEVTVTLGSSFNNLIVFAWTESTVAQNVTFDLAKAKLELGDSSTDYEPVDEALERTACNRYFWRWGNTGAVIPFETALLRAGGTNWVVSIPLPGVMRVAVTSTWSSPTWTTATPTGVNQVGVFNSVAGGWSTITGALTFNANPGQNAVNIVLTAGTSFSGTAGNFGQLNVGSIAYFDFDAEL